MKFTASLLKHASGRYPISMFTWDPKTRTFTCELSTLDEGGRNPRWYRQIYPDAADAGITIMGQKGDVDYYIADEHKDEEGDLQYITLLPTPESERKVPGCKGTKVTLFND